MTEEAPKTPDPSEQGFGVDIAAAMGGRRGLVDSGLPGAVFVLLYTAGVHWWPDEALRYALWAALGLAAGLAVVRVIRHESVQQTVNGLVGVGLGALLAARSGSAADFYLPGLFISAGYGVVYLVSILVGWPLIGVVVGPLLGEGMSWRQDPPRRRAYTRASWLWVAMFALRLAVQVPLYLSGAAIALGAARVLMGWPLFLLVAWLSYALIRSAPPAQEHLAVDGDQ
ncbi:MAG: DUF3159 domain-containing protein [Actinomycetes bacterium]